MPHFERGRYRQTWVGPEVQGRARGTAILFQLRACERSHRHRHRHRVDADEIWLWQAGAPLVLSMGEVRAREQRLGPDVLGDEVVQAAVPAGCRQAIRSIGQWIRVSSTATPGSRIEGSELAPPGWEQPFQT
ncbi:MAG: cupin [Rhodobacter sp.]|nr:cupin [Rhodobacter sp.]